MSKALQDVAAERERQVSQEGWSTDHDDKYDECQLACAAACYAVCDSVPQLLKLKYDDVRLWPWASHWWKPTTYRRNLVKAAALLLAEIERMDRKEAEESK